MYIKPEQINYENATILNGTAMSTASVVAPLLLLVLQSGIHCLTICAIQLLGQTSFDRT